MFVIDREQHHTWYVNSQRYAMHPDFVRAHYLSLDPPAVFFRRNYTRDDRRFVVGTIAWQSPLRRFTWELWEGDLIKASLLEETHKLLQASFFAPLAFKPGSLRQEQESEPLKDVPRVLTSELERGRTTEVLNEGHAIGRLKIVAHNADEEPLAPEEIVIFEEVPVALTPVAGIITSGLGSPLAHIHMLAKGWRIPDVFVRDAGTQYRALEGHWVVLSARGAAVSLEAADCQKLRCIPAAAAGGSLRAPAADLRWDKLTDLKDQRAADAIRFGAKAANLGELLHAHIRDVTVPSGFSIPFHDYATFTEAIGLRARVEPMLADPEFQRDPAVRRRKLEELRSFMQHGELAPVLRQAVLAKVHNEFAGMGLFIRSSTNSEDLPNFNGAGLYTTVPNVKGDDALIEAIKTVWASTWNFEAYEARARAGIDHFAVYHAVLLQRGINADSAGVLITTNPFDRRDPTGVYINAKRGLGMKVVEGTKIPEQIIYRPHSDSVQILTRSAEDSLLTFDEKGGLKSMPSFPDRAVLTDAVARKLARAALRIRRVFHDHDQDVEWVIVGETVYIVQSRPYLG